MTDLKITIPHDKLVAEFTKQMTSNAKEPVEVILHEDGDLVILASEIGCLRIAYKFRNDFEMRVLYSENISSWTVTLYKFYKH